MVGGDRVTGCYQSGLMAPRGVKSAGLAVRTSGDGTSRLQSRVSASPAASSEEINFNKVPARYVHLCSLHSCISGGLHMVLAILSLIPDS